MKQPFLILVICLLQFSLFAQKRARTGNPYLDMKVRPSEKQLKEDSRLNAKELKDFKENTKRSKKQVLTANSEFYTKKKYKQLKGKAPKRKRKTGGDAGMPMF